jgi:ankyrin repeat protein
LDEFIEAACVPLEAGHRSGDIVRAEDIRRAHPNVATDSIVSASILGDYQAVKQFLEANPVSATAKAGPRNWDPLTYLCFSNYLRLDRARSPGFERAAKLLLDAGASAQTGWFEPDHRPKPAWESALYGAAGVAHDAALTRLLLKYGADPNDGETIYHAPETDNNEVLEALIESGNLDKASLATMLLRKADWHNYEGLKLLLENGADPNYLTDWGWTALHQAVRRDNALANIELLLDHGGDAQLKSVVGGVSATMLAARRGRGDVLRALLQRGVVFELQGAERLIAACATNDAEHVRSLAQQDPDIVGLVIQAGGQLLTEFAGVGNTYGVRLLLSLGVDVNALFREGDGYWGLAENSTALHNAAWRLRHATVQFLIERGADVNLRDGRGRTPLMLAARGCIDSFWTERRSPDSVEALLKAGASPQGLTYPTGYEAVDRLLLQQKESKNSST